MIVDIQSDTLDDAFGQLQAHISPGFDVLSARIFIDEDRSVQAGAETIDQAYTEVARKIPGDAVIKERKEVAEPKLRKIVVEALDEKEAILKAKQGPMASGESVQAIRVLTPPKKPLMGMVGKKPGRFELEIQGAALVEVRYHITPRIVASLGVKAMEPLGIQFYCYDYPESVVDHIARFLRENRPHQVLVIGPDAHDYINTEDLRKVAPGQYEIHVNERFQLSWLGATMNRLKQAPDSYNVVVSNFPTHVDDKAAEEYSISGEGNLGTIRLKGQDVLLPFEEFEKTVDLAIFWIGFSPLSYLETVNQLYFKGRSGRRFFQNVIAVTSEKKSSLLSRQDINALRETTDKTCYDLLPQLSLIYDQQGAVWNGGTLN